MTDPFDAEFQALLKQYREDGNMAPVLEKFAEIWREAYEVGHSKGTKFGASSMVLAVEAAYARLK